MVERVHGMDEVARSIRVGSTPTEPHADWRRLGFALGGFVAGEGCFSVRTVRTSSSTAPARKRVLLHSDGRAKPQRAKGLCRRHYYAAYGR